MADRDERIETLYQESAWDLAESVVDLEEAISRVRAVLDNNPGWSYPELERRIRAALDGE